MVHTQDEITLPEKDLIEQLRERVKSELPQTIKSLSSEDQDLYLVRWIRARDNHLENATKMLRSSLEWRKERKADEALKFDIHPFFPQNYPYACPGIDNKGHPVFTIPLADWDFRKIINDADRLLEFEDFVINTFEIWLNKIRESHLKRLDNNFPPVTQFMFVADVNRYPYGQLLSFGAMKKLLYMASTYESHYPEVLFTGIFINCPSYFNLFLKILKPVLAPKTLGKLICYSDMKEWQKDMVEYLDPAILPEQYGGTSK